MTDAEEEDGAELGFPVDPSPEPREEIVERPLQPWHKPRKQWVRREQWRAEIEQLLGELNLSERAFQYLTLPGEDLLDIRYLHRLFEKHKKKFRYLGFDTSRKTVAVSVSEQEVKQLPYVDRDSRTIEDRFEKIGEDGSMAHHATKSFKSFDAINLDLCDAVASRRTQPNHSPLSAIVKLLEQQTNHRTEPWILFLTTRANRASVNSEVATKFAKILQSNIERYESFRRGLHNTGIFSPESVSREIDLGDGLSADEFPNAFGVAFSKWLLSCAKVDWYVTQRNVAGYRVNDSERPDMLSLVFRFEKVPKLIEDPSEVIVRRRTRSPLRQTPEELEVAFIEKFATLFDVDTEMHNNPDLREQLIKENAELVSLARYDRQHVLAWGRDNCWQPN